LALGLAACSSSHPPAAGHAAAAASAGGPIIGAIDHALDRASEKVRTRDITFAPDGKHGGGWRIGPADSGRGVTITPKGDLTIDGKVVALTAAQRADVLAYRGQLIGVAEQGLQIGRQGAALGLRAAGEALAMVFNGNSEPQIKDRVDAQATDIKHNAAALCQRLPALRASQQKLAAAVPEFRHYATMDQKDIDDCEASRD
jgi:hypothetical protein